jgi:formate dehydrogenase iron-sulfur subunit
MRALLLDFTKCIGCGSCVEACRAQNNLPAPPEGAPPPAKLDARNFTVLRTASGPGDQTVHYRRMCMHCLDPTCASACPVGALRKTPAGPVVYDPSLCLGCRYCMQACPFNVPRYEWNSRNPRIRKCNFCADRLAEGRPNACAEACPVEATLAGEREELLEIARRRIAAEPDKYVHHIYGEREAGGTSVLVLSPIPFDQVGLPANLDAQPLPWLTFRVLRRIPHLAVFGGAVLTGLWWITNRRNEVAAAEADAAGKKEDRP